MRKILMTVTAALVFLGTAVGTKAVSLINSSDVSMSQTKDNVLVLKHASELFGDNDMSMTGHTSHSSHGSHGSHGSHSSHYSSS